MAKEARARIKINKLLEEGGWRFFDDEKGLANIQTEAHLKDLGDDFENAKSTYTDYMLLDKDNFPFVILEAKSEQKDPLDGKEQARRDAQKCNARFVMLSNGN